MKTQLEAWLSTVESRPSGDILAVQTIRNAIMAASVLASAAMVALMGVIATTPLHPRGFGVAAALVLAASAASAVAPIVRLARAGFELQLVGAPHEALASSLHRALTETALSAALLATALLLAATSLLV